MVNKKQKENAFDTLKKMPGRILDKLFKDEDKKNFIDNLKKEAEAQKSLEDIDKLLYNKYWQKFLNNLKKRDIDKGIDALKEKNF